MRILNPLITPPKRNHILKVQKVFLNKVDFEALAYKGDKQKPKIDFDDDFEEYGNDDFEKSEIVAKNSGFE